MKNTPTFSETDIYEYNLVQLQMKIWILVNWNVVL